MSHSIFDYLKRRSNEELESALKLCLQDAGVERNKETILMILQILLVREQDTIPQISPESMERIKAVLEKYYEEQGA